MIFLLIFCNSGSLGLINSFGYSRYENGNLDVPSAVLITLANFHKVSIDYILGQTDNPKRNPSKK
nr:helix-turn-helix domain-containing protein [Paenibacillus sp. B2(2019)]